MYPDDEQPTADDYDWAERAVAWAYLVGAFCAGGFAVYCLCRILG